MLCDVPIVSQFALNVIVIFCNVDYRFLIFGLLFIFNGMDPALFWRGLQLVVIVITILHMVWKRVMKMINVSQFPI